ncbi:hypothetical protein [Pantoea sp. Nvir]|uniref:hypothetical protein n=1 Tax=Pantoea sp. Nvir TaxID=2576760 RepID=UPI00135B2C8D|nr:hypothetical protein [Pantoea sp. Nvir]MXP66800.1 hypothetical protein [Pantoea sp. Nvir]
MFDGQRRSGSPEAIDISNAESVHLYCHYIDFSSIQVLQNTSTAKYSGAHWVKKSNLEQP